MIFSGLTPKIRIFCFFALFKYTFAEKARFLVGFIITLLLGFTLFLVIPLLHRKFSDKVSGRPSCLFKLKLGPYGQLELFVAVKLLFALQPGLGEERLLFAPGELLPDGEAGGEPEGGSGAAKGGGEPKPEVEARGEPGGEPEGGSGAAKDGGAGNTSPS
jgi:hypothetical protein